MSRISAEIKSKFWNIDCKIEKKIEKVNSLFKDQSKLLDEKFSIDNFKEKYSNGFNSYRQELLNYIMLNSRLEIDQVNEALARNDENILKAKMKKLKQIEFKQSKYKSSKICSRMLIIKEFKFTKKFSTAQLIKYKNILQIREYLNDNGEELNNKKALFLACKKGYLEMVKYLVENGVDINVNNEDNR